MKSVISIFLICYFSFAAIVPRMDFDRLATIPNLVGHFIDHDEKGDDDLNIIEFINIHYGDKGEKPDDGHELPFHGHDCSITANLLASLAPGLAGHIPFNPPFTELADTYSFHLTAQQLSDIWQPPRV